MRHGTTLYDQIIVQGTCTCTWFSSLCVFPLLLIEISMWINNYVVHCSQCDVVVHTYHTFSCLCRNQSEIIELTVKSQIQQMKN